MEARMEPFAAILVLGIVGLLVIAILGLTAKYRAIVSMPDQRQ
jgi:hypothetical protein